MKKEITAEQVRALLDYDPETGIFTWSKSLTRKGMAGRRVGTIAANGYVMIQLLGKVRLAHRLAWLITFGELPKDSIDHINRIRHDNRLINLRDVPQEINAKNHPSNPRLVGAMPDGKGGWSRTVIEYGVEQSKAGFETPEAANKAYLHDQKWIGNPYQKKPKLRLDHL